MWKNGKVNQVSISLTITNPAISSVEYSASVVANVSGNLQDPRVIEQKSILENTLTNRINHIWNGSSASYTKILKDLANLSFAERVPEGTYSYKFDLDGKTISEGMASL